MQERPKAIWLWFFLGLVFHGAHPSDAASDRIGGPTGRRASDGEVDQLVPEVGLGIRVSFYR